jgi:hypothetical protein
MLYVLVKKAESGDEAAKAVRIAFAASSPLSAFFTITMMDRGAYLRSN